MDCSYPLSNQFEGMTVKSSLFPTSIDLDDAKLATRPSIGIN